ncbi:hypothetical protein I4U23_004659 [Adineta vaga]|nr:hypothetical protein I4U23_004659 [Adineta vaga]
MDRIYARAQNLLSVRDLSLKLFRENIILYPLIHRQYFKNALLEMMAQERQGEIIDRTIMKDNLNMFTQFNVIKDNFYDEEFQSLCLQRLAQIYESVSEKLLAENGALVYMQKVYVFINEETERVNFYVDQSIEKRLIELLTDEFIIKHKEHLKEMKKTSIYRMLDLNQYKEFEVTYKIYQRVPGGVVIIAECIGSYVCEEGKKLLMKNDIQSKDSMHLIDTFFNLKEKFDHFLGKAFNSDSIIEEQIDSTLAYLVNLNEHNQEYLVLFIDEHIKDKQNLSNQKIVALMSAIVVLHYLKAEDLVKQYYNYLKENSFFDQIFQSNQYEILAIIYKVFQRIPDGYLKEQDTFEEYFKEHLAEHLLSKQSASDDIEEYMLSLLTNTFGNQFTSKLKGMLQDISLSKSLTEDFRSHVTKNGSNLYGIDLTIQILKTDCWPISSVNNRGHLPIEIQDVYQCLQDFYLNKHNGRRLTLLSRLGSADLKTQKYILQVSTQQMIILMLFNKRDSWSFENILHETDIDEEDAKQALLPFIFNKKTEKILNKEPTNNNIELTDRFSVNDFFTSKLYRVKIYSLEVKISHKPEREHIQNKLDGHREMEIRAAIVRMMKSSQTMTHNQLMAEVIDTLKCRFTPSPVLIERVIERLIEADYLSRSQDDRKTYIYMP